MKYVEKARVWLETHWKLVVAGVGLALSAIAMVLSRNNRITNPVVALRTKKIAKEIATKEARAEALEQAAENQGETVAALQEEIAASKRRVAKNMEGPIVDGMTDAEIADLYRRSGL